MVLAASQPAISRSATECQSQYETFRRQALETHSLSSRNGLDLAFIERQGLAAWMERAPDGAAAGAVLAAPPGREPGQAEPLHRDLILVLVDWVRGDRQEEPDGRPD